MRVPDYLWIMRCGKSNNANYSVEYKLIGEAPPKKIIPLVEVTNKRVLRYFYSKLKNKYGEVWVDLPYYLAEDSNYFQQNVDDLKSIYASNPEDFFKNHSMNIDVPVVSAPQSFSFDNERNIYNKLTSDFKKIAVRLRVPTFDISATMESSLKKLVNKMRARDVLLLDVFRFTSIESQIISNIEKMKNIAQNNNIEVFILNAFDTDEENCHNYGPLLSAYFDVAGFGDFATDERYKAAGGRGGRTKKIRYYEPSSYTLRFLIDTVRGYPGAKTRLVNSGYWSNTSTPTHLSRCKVCDEVKNNSYGKDHKSWKRFKILHYLWCWFNETASQLSAVNNPEDLDPDGYDIIVKS